ncbi:SpoIIE family protein phosphatase [Streptomyces sp. NBC_00344]|uniref:SpoIIE family protein phosphatase n=1 Tax=Streptomyces sp. NBC_00344 TaxID=2975720 RepID=UPI002E22B204
MAFTVGRHSGKGIQATTAMGQIRTAIHSLSSLDLECDELLARLNDTVARLANERSGLDLGELPREEELTVGCPYGTFDPRSGPSRRCPRPLRPPEPSPALDGLTSGSATAWAGFRTPPRAGQRLRRYRGCVRTGDGLRSRSCTCPATRRL